MPPPSSQNGYTVSEFLREFEEYASMVLLSHPGNMCLLGDFNFLLDKAHDTNAHLIANLLSSLDLQQHVSHPLVELVIFST